MAVDYTKTAEDGFLDVLRKLYEGKLDLDPEKPLKEAMPPLFALGQFMGINLGQLKGLDSFLDSFMNPFLHCWSSPSWVAIGYQFAHEQQDADTPKQDVLQVPDCWWYEVQGLTHHHDCSEEGKVYIEPFHHFWAFVLGPDISDPNLWD